MAREFIDGFASGGFDLWDSWSGTPTVVAAPAGMSGNAYCLYMTAHTYIIKSLSAADAYYTAQKFNCSPTANDCGVISFLNGTTVLGSLYVSTARILSAYKGDLSTLLASAAVPLVITTPYLIEVYYKPHASAGFFQVKVNGSMVINFAGNTTVASLQINGIRLKGDVGGADSGPAYYGDIIIDNAGWIGNTFVQGIYPNGVGNSSQFTPSVGSNYSCVDEKPAVDTDYVATNTADLLDTYAHTALAGVATVKSVQVQARVVQEGAPAVVNLKLALRSVGVDYLSVDNAVPTTTPKSVSKIWQTDPLDASPWTPAKVDATEIGMKSAA